MWKNYNYIFLREIKGRVRAIRRRTRYSNWILGSSTESAYLAADYLYVCESFCSAQLLNAIRIYRNNFQPEQLKEPYVVACVNVIAADSDKESGTISHFQETILGDTNWKPTAA
jgi:alkanesulfonate monooxygenase SsuD/methylene tetrahydromethanopterin reductase-like flavin-dependent oxidoreductase (luciferase family)